MKPDNDGRRCDDVRQTEIQLRIRLSHMDSHSTLLTEFLKHPTHND